MTGVSECSQQRGNLKDDGDSFSGQLMFGTNETSTRLNNTRECELNEPTLIKSFEFSTLRNRSGLSNLN
ncbi:hypothetical protein [Photorhabdus bodei]|uniref:hypothetical protein n=1 Tax=Photorhabdus bodei TaxID=2029681 RepID=UPI0011BEE055|nr:hypothetical protein [Photorhabdus bodei]